MGSASPTGTAIVGAERDESLPATGEAVEAEEGTGFLFTGSVLGTVTVGRDGGAVIVEEV